VSLAALPFFAAKFIVGPTSGFLLQNFCPETGTRNPAMLWGIIALSTLIGPFGMWLLRGWIQEAKSAPETPAVAS
jgi:hypothetical protein